MRGHWLATDELGSRKLNCDYAIELLRGTLQAVGSWLISTDSV